MQPFGRYAASQTLPSANYVVTTGAAAVIASAAARENTRATATGTARASVIPHRTGTENPELWHSSSDTVIPVTYKRWSAHM